MPLEFHRAMIDRLPDPVLLLDDHGDVVGFNPAARALLQSTPDLVMTLTPVIHAAMAQVAVEPLQLRPAVPLALSGQHYVPWLMPTREDIALILLPADAGPPTRHQPIGSPQDVAFSALLSSEIRNELRTLIDKIGSLGSLGVPLRPDLQRMQQLLTTVDMMCNLLQHPEAAHGERLALHDLVLQALARRRLSSACLTQSGFARAPGTRHFYGHGPWLLWALDTLLELMHVSAELEGRQLTLHLRHGDSSLVLSGGLRSSITSTTQGTDSASVFVSLEAIDSRQKLNLDTEARLSLAAQIVEYHGGYLHVERDPGDDGQAIRGFQFSMPLGRAPASASTAPPGQWVPLRQAEMLARDLARLLPRRSSRAVPLSDEERDMLAHLCDHPQQD